MKNKHKRGLAYLLAGFIGACGLALIVHLTALGVSAFISFMNDPVKQWYLTDLAIPAKAEATMNLSVREKIIYYSDIFGVDTETALRIAQCESNFNPKAENINGSATGIYQFIRRTWVSYCEGDVYNEDANIICFLRMYPKHPEWWECK